MFVYLTLVYVVAFYIRRIYVFCISFNMSNPNVFSQVVTSYERGMEVVDEMETREVVLVIEENGGNK